MRAYLRLDPNLRRQKKDYPDGAFRAFVELLCASEAQPQRGRFESHALLKAMLGPRGRWIKYLIEHGDLAADGDELIVVGWSDWQEGDVTVPERMARLRAKKASRPSDTVPVTPEVTVPVTPARLAVAVGGDGKPLAASNPAVSLPGEDDPLTIICQLVMSAAPIEDKEFRTKVDDQVRRYGADWVTAAYRQAHSETIEAGNRPRQWELRKTAEVHLAARTRAEELRQVEEQHRAEQAEREKPRPTSTPEEQERQSLMRKAVGVWIRGGRKGEVPEDVDGLRAWLDQNGSPA
jgi:hypothetical protein